MNETQKIYAVPTSTMNQFEANNHNTAEENYHYECKNLLPCAGMVSELVFFILGMHVLYVFYD
jgi:hypothetical protein